MSKPKILFLSGSSRKNSVNQILANNAFNIAKNLDSNQNTDHLTMLDLKEYPLPIYDQDLEATEGLPENAKKLYKIFMEHDALFIASPEYNGSMSPLLKNLLDWVSRNYENGSVPKKAYQNKVIAISSASPSVFGGSKGLVGLQIMLIHAGAIVLPNYLSMADAYNKFDDNGKLTDKISYDILEKSVQDLIRITKSIKESIM